MVILGGMGNIWGVAAGAFIVYMIQTVLLKQLNAITEALVDIPILSTTSTSPTTSSCSTASPWC